MFECWGKKLELEQSNDTVTHSGYTAWSSCYSSFTINNSFCKITLKINALNRKDGIHIGISPSEKYINCPFYHNQNSLSLCSDGSQFVEGGKIINANNGNGGYVAGDTIILSIVHNEIFWQFNNEIKWSQYIEPNTKYRLALSIWKRYDSVSVLAVDMKSDTQISLLLLQRQAMKQRQTMTDIGGLEQPMTVGQYWYPINKKWYETWQEFVHLNDEQTDEASVEIKADESLNILYPGPIDNCRLSASITDYKNMFNINFNQLNKRDYTVIDLIFGYIHQQQRQQLITVIPDIVKYCCLAYYGLMTIKRDVEQHDDCVLIHENIWNNLILWYGGGPIFKRKVYVPPKDGRRSYNYYMAPVPFVCLFPQWVNISYCDGNNGTIDLNKLETKEFPSSYTLRAVATLIEDELGIEQSTDKNVSHTRFWMKFGQIKHIFAVDVSVVKTVKITADDLEELEIDQERFVEVADDYVKKIKLSELTLNDNDAIVIERKQSNNTWPRAKHYESDSDQNWRLNLEVGDIIDAKDFKDKWYEVFIRYIYPKGHENEHKIVVHYIGWNVKWAEMLDIYKDAEKIEKRNTHTKGPHRSR